MTKRTTIQTGTKRTKLFRSLNTVYSQHWLDLRGSTSPTQCPNSSAACVQSDIAPDGGDCAVNLSDLGAVLSGFAPGVPGKSRAEGDIAPLAGDGVVDLSDLGQILSDYGSDCR